MKSPKVCRKVYDVENYPNFVSFVFKDVNTGRFDTFYRLHDEKGYVLEDNLEEMCDWLTDLAKESVELELIGYNNLFYDSIILHSVYLDPLISPSNLFDMTKTLIERTDELTEEERDYFFRLRYNRDIPFVQRDCMTIMAFNRVPRVSLKMCGVHLGHELIQDLPIKPGTMIRHSDLPMILEYNKNDVEINHKLYKHILPEIELRDGVTEMFGVNVRNQSRSGMATKLLTAKYCEHTGISKKALEKQRTVRTHFTIADCFGMNIGFKTKQLQEFLDKVANTQVIKYPLRISNLLKRIRAKDVNLDRDEDVIKGCKFIATLKLSECMDEDLKDDLLEIQESWNNKNSDIGERRNLLKRFKKSAQGIRYAMDKFAYKYSIEFDGNHYDFGIGGIHSKDAPGIFESDSFYQYIDSDVTSYYPMLIVQNGFVPAHLDRTAFIEIFFGIIQERIKAKKLGKEDVVKALEAEALKILINASFGKFGSEYSWLMDHKAMISVTITGQLQLLMLIEMLSLIGIKTVSANTDGIICKVPVARMDEYKAKCREWEELVKMSLEYTHYDKYVRRDVNNYITIKSDDPNYPQPVEKRLKTKGIFITGMDLAKGFAQPIRAKALLNYFVYETPVSETIRKEVDITRFCFSQKASGGFDIQHSTLGDYYGEEEVEHMQKTNRYYVTNSRKKGGSLTKEKREDDRVMRTSILAGEYVAMLNSYDVLAPIKSYGVDYGFYENEVEKVLNLIKPKHVQLGLFG